MKNNYTDLTPNVAAIFQKFRFVKLDGMGKPYYAGLNEGKIYNVIATNKLRAMKDGSTPKKYGSLKLKQSNGKFKTIKIHRIIASFKENPNNNPIVHHKTGLKNHNGIDELEWSTQSENIKCYYAEKRLKEATEEPK